LNFSISRRSDIVVDVTPLIDIIFQLVLFFMVSTEFVTTPGIEVDLPRSSSDMILRDDNELEIWVSADGVVEVDDVAVDWDTLQQSMSRVVQNNPNTLVIVKADRDVDHGLVVSVLDLARSSGLARLAIATQSSQDDR